MKEKFVQAHMRVAHVYAELSYAKRLKVGAIVVKDNRVISIGYNGTPSGWNNICETLDEKSLTLTTKPEVIHAEANAIAKLAKNHDSGLNADMFITHAPCIECAKLIYGAGIKQAYFKQPYRDYSGIEFLNKCNIGVEQVE